MGGGSTLPRTPLQAGGSSRGRLAAWEGNGGFVDVIWTEVSFQGAFLTGASFEGMDLTGVTFQDAYLDGVIWGDATCPDGFTPSYSGTCCGQFINGDVPTSGCAVLPEGP